MNGYPRILNPQLCEEKKEKKRKEKGKKGQVIRVEEEYHEDRYRENWRRQETPAAQGRELI